MEEIEMYSEEDKFVGNGFGLHDMNGRGQNDCTVLITIPSIDADREVSQRIKKRGKYSDEDEYFSSSSLVELLDMFEDRNDRTFKQLCRVYFHRCVVWASLIARALVCIPVEMATPWWRVIIIYFTGVVVGTLVSVINDPTNHFADANGGVYSVNTAHLAYIIMTWSEWIFPYYHLFAFILLICPGVGISIFNRYFLGLNQNGDYTANIASALAGLLIGTWIFNTKERPQIVKQLWWAAFMFYILIMATAIVINIVWTDYF